MATLGARKEAVLEAKDAEGNVIEEYRALFTNRALADAEVKLGNSITRALNGFISGRSGIREIAIILQAGMDAYRRSVKASGNAVSFDDACDVLDAVGVMPAAAVIGKAINAVVSYGNPEPSEGEEDEEEKNG
jgi:hypothetical protein